MASCRGGARITACVVDAPNYLFQCSENGERQFSMPFIEGHKLECASPEDIEYFLNACKRGEIVEVTQCKFKLGNQFMCKDVMGTEFPMYVEEMDNYFCLTPQDRKRVISRCKNQ